jgi:apolipoprotein N-acyltransferase
VKRLALAAAAGLLHASSFPPYLLWPERALPFAALGALAGVALFLHALRGATLRSAPLVGLTFGLVGLALPGSWLPAATEAAGSGALVGVLLLLALASTVAVYAVLHVLARERLAGWPFVVLAWWLSLEALRGLCPAEPFGWYTLGHAVASSLPLSQSAGTLGEAGLSALVLASALLLEQALELRRAQPSRAATYAVAGIGIPVVVWQVGFYGLVSAVSPEASEPRALIAILVQDDGPVAARLETSRRGLARARFELTPVVDLVAWPEASLDAEPTPAELAPLATAAVAVGRGLLLPDRAVGADGRSRSRALVVASDGTVLARIGKSSRDPLLEPDVDPDETGPALFAPRADAVVGLVLGQDGTKPSILRRLRRDGARVLVVASHDPGNWPRHARLQQAALLTLRACELRCPVIHVAPRGVSFAVDQYGRPFTTVHGSGRGHGLARVLAPHGRTPFESGGHAVPAIAGVAGAVALAALALSLVRKSGP